MYFTLQDIINMKLVIGAKDQESKLLKQVIDEFLNSDEYQDMQDGHNYYLCKHDILDEDFRIYYDKNRQQKTDLNKANNKIVHAAHRRMVIEKSSCLLNNDVSITHESDTAKAEDLQKFLGRNWQQMLFNASTGASNKGIEWIHPYLDGEDLKFMIMNSMGCIPIYETSRQEKLVSMIRFYTMTNEDGNDFYKVEWYFENRIEYWEQDKKGNFYKEKQTGHINLVQETPDAKIQEADSWGIVPFIPVKNNPYNVTDLVPIKAVLDAIDRSKSTFTNNLEDIQEVMLKVMGAGAEDPNEIRQNFKKSKVVVVRGGMDGSKTDIGTIEVQIPHEARKIETDDLFRVLYAYGMGLNPFQEQMGNATGVYLQ